MQSAELNADNRTSMDGRPNEPYPAGDPSAWAHDITLGDEHVRVVEAGPSDGFPIILLHGWGASAYNFRGLLGPLAEAGYRAIAPDLRGHGWSSTRLARGAWTRQAMVEWTRRVMDTLGVRDCILGGQSIGATLALDAAAAMPDRVQATVLFAPTGFTHIWRVLLAKAFPWVTFRTTPRWLVARILHDIYGKRGRWTERDVDEYWMPLRRSDVVRAVLQSVREYDFSLRSPDGIDSSRLVIRFGEFDGLIPYEKAMRHAAQFSGADVAVMPGVGHVPADEVPDDVVKILLGVAEGKDKRRTT